MSSLVVGTPLLNPPQGNIRDAPACTTLGEYRDWSRRDVDVTGGMIKDFDDPYEGGVSETRRTKEIDLVNSPLVDRTKRTRF